MRLFVAVWPPPPAVDDLARRVAALRHDSPAFDPPASDRPVAGAGLRWTRTEQWHLTLTFLGEVGDSALPELTRRLARTAHRHPPPVLRFAGAGRFGHRVLFTRVEGDREGLRKLAASAAAAARRSGVNVDERPYRPHLTLARAIPGSDLSPVVTALAPYRGPGWEASTLTLVRSRLGAGPGRTSGYETVMAWPLEGRRAE